MLLKNEQANASDNQDLQYGIGHDDREKLGFQRSLNLIVVGVFSLFFALGLVAIIGAVAYQLIFN